MHTIYGSSNNYIPKLTSPGGVGYYYIASSSTPATLSGVQDDITKTLEDATNINAGSAQLGNLGSLSNESFETLQEGVHFQYDKRLDASTTEDATDGFGAVDGGLIDTGVSGDLAAGTAIRIVDGSSGSALNIKDVSGLNLKVYAKNLVSITSPPSDRIYVDPASGKFVLPRPEWWSKCENLANITSIPDIGTAASLTTSGNAVVLTFPSGKFNNSVAISARTTNTYGGIRLSETTPSSGCLSFWVLAENANKSIISINGIQSQDLMVGLRINFLNHTNAEYRLLTLVYKESGYTSYTHGLTSGWHHIYVVWDTAKSLTGSKSVRAFLDGTERCYLTVDIPKVVNYPLQFTHNNSGQTSAAIDNIKYWPYVPSESPDWEYNSGTGRENALHTIYGSASDYAPVLTSPGGVGYYKSGSAGSKAIIRI
jgi:hypothetical protein